MYLRQIVHWHFHLGRAYDRGTQSQPRAVSLWTLPEKFRMATEFAETQNDSWRISAFSMRKLRQGFHWSQQFATTHTNQSCWCQEPCMPRMWQDICYIFRLKTAYSHSQVNTDIFTMGRVRDLICMHLWEGCAREQADKNIIICWLRLSAFKLSLWCLSDKFNGPGKKL